MRASALLQMPLRGGGGGLCGAEMTKWRLQNPFMPLLMVEGNFRRRSR